MAYNVYPAVDEKNAFPEPVRKAIADSTEVKTKISDVVDPKITKINSELTTKLDTSIENITTAVGETTAKVLTDANTHTNKLRSDLSDSGLVIGRWEHKPHTAVDPLVDVSFRHTTANGEYLPLGYDRRGHLDAHAIAIWSEDLQLPEKINTHPTYAKIITTTNNDLLLGIRWDGTIEAPGLSIPKKEEDTRPTYQDAPYVPGSIIFPVKAVTTSWTGWGSSSMGGIYAYLKVRGADLGVTGYFNGGQGGEKSDHIAARLGSIPAKLTFVNDTINASGVNPVTSTNVSVHGSLKPYTGWVVSTDGTKVHGTVSSTSSTLNFSRTEAGVELAIRPDTPFIPEEGEKHRADTSFLWMGKNNITDSDKVIADTLASYKYFAPLMKRVIVLGHFVDSNIPAVSSNRTHLLKVNAAYAEQYGNAYMDVQNYITSPEIWVDTQITPTAEDLEHQARGSKPPSLSSDALHLNGAGYTAVSKRLKTHIQNLGWY